MLVLAYSLFRWGAGRDAAIGLGIMAIGLVASVITDFTGAGDLVSGLAVLLFTVALGVINRYRSTAREQMVEQAKFQERAQLARELHDTVAHHVSAIAIQAQAGLFLARSSSLRGATEALEIIDREAAHTLTEMRTMVVPCGTAINSHPCSPGRRIADIERLGVNGTDSLRIDVKLSGELTNLPPALEAALYRVAQQNRSPTPNATRTRQHESRSQ